MNFANLLLVFLLVQNSRLEESQSIYVPQLTPQDQNPPFSLASLTPAPSRPLPIAPAEFAPNPAVTPELFDPDPNPDDPDPNPVIINPAPVTPPAPAPVQNQPLDDFLQQPQNQNQECYVRQCDQLISGRNLLYSRALEIVQNEEYLTEADLNLIRRRYRRQSTNGQSMIPSISTVFSNPVTTSESVQEDDFIRTLITIGVGIGTVAVGALYAIPDLPLTLPSGVPPGNPEPGTPGGGGPPNTLLEAVALVPLGLNAIAVFPPYNTPRTIPAISVIFAENPAIGNPFDFLKH